MNARTEANPVSLSYVSALRGVKPRKPGENFAYAELCCSDAGLLTCLAASNPEGKFFGLVENDALKTKAEGEAKLRGAANVTFLTGTPQTLLAQIVAGSAQLPMLDYLSCDESKKPLNAADRKALFAVAERLLRPSGLLHYSYKAYDRDDGHLRFLVRELGPEMDAKQADEFLTEIKKLGGAFLAKHPDIEAKLEDAIKRHAPDDFFAHFKDGEAISGSFDTLIALAPRGFAFAGSANIASNYIELSVPTEAQDVIASCTENPHYEQIKDFALDRTVRGDIWCRMPANRTDSLPELFGGFTYGITMARDEVPASIDAMGKKIDLSAPIFAKLVELLTLTPASIGDFLSHPLGAGFDPAQAVGSLQILIACGIAQPMRGVHEAGSMLDIVKPQLVGSFNKYLDKLPVAGEELYLASPVLGGAMAISPRDALVIQALGRAGLANSVSALLPELERLAKNPAIASRIMDVTEPTPELAQSMIQDTVSKSIVQWYAYGLLEAA